MGILVLKLVLTPLLIGGASLAARRWGQAVAGWLVGLPLTSGPIALFLALERGAHFAALATMGSLAGAIGEAAFCVVYAHVADRGRWPLAMASASAAFVLTAIAVQWPALGPTTLAFCAFASLVVALRLLPRRAPVSVGIPSPPWDLPARMVIATALVVTITGVAPLLGPRLSGVLATFPVYAAILTVFAHRADAAQAVHVLKGLLVGLFAFSGFFVVLGALIERIGLAAAFAAAVVSALAIQAMSLAAILTSRAARPAS